MTPPAIRHGREEQRTMESKGKATLNFGDGKTLEFPVSAAPSVPTWSTSARSTARPACSPTTRASCPPRAAARPSPTSTATRACCCIAATRSSSSRENCDFLEVCYLLLNGELPNAGAEGRVRRHVTRHTMVHEQLTRFYQGFRRDAHPMAVLVGVVGALSAFYHDSLDINDPQHREISAFRLIAKMPTIVGDGLQVHHGPAVHVSEERPVVHREFHAHDVRRAGRGVRAERRAGARAGPHLHPARRPRAERLDLDGAAARARRARIRSPASPRASPASGARRTAARTRRRCNMLEEIGDVVARSASSSSR